jgi:hypothetical protein
MVRNWVLERTGVDGRIGNNVLPTLLKWTGFYQDPITRALQVGSVGALGSPWLL